MIVRVSAVLKDCRSFVKCDRLFDNLCSSHLHWGVKMSLICGNVGHFQGDTHPDSGLSLSTSDKMIPGFKPLTEVKLLKYDYTKGQCNVLVFLSPCINDKTSSISEMFYSAFCEGISLFWGEYINANEVIAFSLYLMNKMPGNLIRRYNSHAIFSWFYRLDRFSRCF